MNKLILGTTLAALCGAATFALPALAQQTATDGQAATQVAPAAQASANAGTTQPERTVPPLDSSMCIRYTGSHLKPPKGGCLPVAGNSYSQEDIRRTGAPNLGRALQMLDPSVTVHGH